MAGITFNPQWGNAKGPYRMDDDGTLRYATGTTYLSAVRNGQVADAFNDDLLYQQKVRHDAVRLIGNYLKNMKYPEPEYPFFTRQEKKQQRKYRRMRDQFIDELKEALQLREEKKVEVEQEPEENESEQEDQFDVQFMDYEEEYFRKTVGPKSYWSKPYELEPRPHHQRRSKNSLSKLRYDARKTHEKHQYLGQEYYDDLEYIIEREDSEHLRLHYPEYRIARNYWMNVFSSYYYDSDDDY